MQAPDSKNSQLSFRNETRFIAPTLQNHWRVHPNYISEVVCAQLPDANRRKCRDPRGFAREFKVGTVIGEEALLSEANVQPKFFSVSTASAKLVYLSRRKFLQSLKNVNLRASYEYADWLQTLPAFKSLSKVARRKIVQ